MPWETPPIGKGKAEEEIDRILLVETPKADADAAVLQVLVDQLHVTTPDIVLFEAPTLANFASADVEVRIRGRRWVTRKRPARPGNDRRLDAPDILRVCVLGGATSSRLDQGPATLER